MKREAIDAKCGKCGSPAKIYPAKCGAALVCPECSPAWLGPFLEARMIEANKEEEGHGHGA